MVKIDFESMQRVEYPCKDSSIIGDGIPKELQLLLPKEETPWEEFCKIAEANGFKV